MIGARRRPLLDAMTTPERLRLEASEQAARDTPPAPCPFHDAPPAVPPPDAAHSGRRGL
jgi:hypothetical protein